MMVSLFVNEGMGLVEDAIAWLRETYPEVPLGTLFKLYGRIELSDYLDDEKRMREPEDTLNRLAKYCNLPLGDLTAVSDC